jgi:4-hydroxy-3-methylbut-2-enyl diphosphate reductase IspH
MYSKAILDEMFEEPFKVAFITNDFHIYRSNKYAKIAGKICENYRNRDNERLIEIHDTICKRVSNRAKEIKEFANQFDAILFVSDEKSSNGLFLYEVCKKQNPNTFFISSTHQLQDIELNRFNTIGICGATSTPVWLMEKIFEKNYQRGTLITTHPLFLGNFERNKQKKMNH